MKTTTEMKNNVNECTKVGDVCMIKGIKATMVDVERKIFVTTAWTWDDTSCSPCESKEDALRCADRSDVGEYIYKVIKAHFAICYTEYYPSCVGPSWVRLYEITSEEPTIEELAAEAKRVDIYIKHHKLYPSFKRVSECYRELRVGVNEKFYEMVFDDDVYGDGWGYMTHKVCHERPEDYKEWGVDVSKSHFRNICADIADEEAFAELWECVVVMGDDGRLRVEETPIERCYIRHNCVTKTYKPVNGFWEECIEKQ